MERITLGTRRTSTRLELEMDVTSHNKYLASAARRMTDVQLLRNAHPIYREDFAKRLHEEGSITKNTLKSLLASWGIREEKYKNFLQRKKQS